MMTYDASGNLMGYSGFIMGGGGGAGVISDLNPEILEFVPANGGNVPPPTHIPDHGIMIQPGPQMSGISGGIASPSPYTYQQQIQQQQQQQQVHDGFMSHHANIPPPPQGSQGPPGPAVVTLQHQHQQQHHPGQDHHFHGTNPNIPQPPPTLPPQAGFVSAPPNIVPPTHIPDNKKGNAISPPANLCYNLCFFFVFFFLKF